jgi:hypothetical protein
MIRRAGENVGSVGFLGVGFVCTWKFNPSLFIGNLGSETPRPARVSYSQFHMHSTVTRTEFCGSMRYPLAKASLRLKHHISSTAAFLTVLT